MRKATSTLGRDAMGPSRTRARRIIVTGLLGLLIWTHSFPATAKVKSDWARVQNVAPGTKTTVVLYTDRAPAGKRKVKGRFHSATPGCITVTLKRGQTRTLGKQAVFRVLVDRPPYEGLITAGASGGIFLGLAPGWDLNARGWALFGGLFVGVPTAIAFLVAPKMRNIYNVPRKLREDPAPPPPQTAARQSSSTSGSRLLLLAEKASGAERLRLQARQAVMRQDLPLDLSSLSVSIDGEYTDCKSRRCRNRGPRPLR